MATYSKNLVTGRQLRAARVLAGLYCGPVMRHRLALVTPPFLIP